MKNTSKKTKINIINNSKLSLKIEDFKPSKNSIKLTKDFLNNKISEEQAFNKIKEHHNLR